MGARDPRHRTNAAGRVADADLDQKTVQRDADGRMRVSALDGLPLLKAEATLSEAIAYINTMRAKLRGTL